MQRGYSTGLGIFLSIVNCDNFSFHLELLSVLFYTLKRMRLKRPVSFLTSNSNVTQTSLFSQVISYFSQIEDDKLQTSKFAWD